MSFEKSLKITLVIYSKLINMPLCYICKTIANFSCSCTSDILYMCNLHNQIHSFHFDFRFIYTKNLKNQQRQIIKDLNTLEEYSNDQLTKLCVSETDFIKKIKELYQESRKIIAQSLNDIKAT